jgi:hypothetical protein
VEASGEASEGAGQVAAEGGRDVPTAAAGRLRPARPGPWLPDAAAMIAFLALAVTVTAGLWGTWGSAATADNTRDHAQFLFFFEHAAHAFTHGENPLFTDAMGAPYGVNLMANTAFLGMAVPLIPVTLVAGAGVSYALALTISLAGTAAAWYVMLRRHVTSHRGVAFAAAALAGFSPGIVGHGNGHPNLAAQFLLPLIVSAVIRLRASPRPVRSGLVLGLMVTYQMFLNEELLMLTAFACGLMTLIYIFSRPSQARAEATTFLTGLGVAAGVAAALLAYPLWFQFFGPQRYHGPFTWATFYWTDVTDYPAYGSNALAGRLGSASAANDDPGETNAFLGLPLVLFALVAAVALRRVLAARIAAVVAAVFALFSFGRTIMVKGVDTQVPGPWRLVADLPLFDAVIAPRLALVVTPAVAVLLAVAADRLLVPSGGPDQDTVALRQVLTWGLLAAVLVPLVPTPLRTTAPEPVPEFFTAGTWQRYVTTGTLVPVPPDGYSETTLRWLVASRIGPRFADGYFLGPTSPDQPVARYGPPDRPTGLLLGRVAESGVVPEITDGLRAIALDDLRHWGADALVLGPRANDEALRQAVDLLLSRSGVQVGGVWVWDVRDLVP